MPEPERETLTVTIPQDVGAELQAMCMIEQVVEHTTLTGDARHRIAVWFDNRYRDWTGDSDG